MIFLSNEEIGLKIKEFRLKQGLTQTQLGEKLGVGAAAVNKWESGLVKNIKRETIQRISMVLNISPVTLIGIVEEPSNDIIIKASEFTSSELAEIRNFIQYVKSKRG